MSHRAACRTITGAMALLLLSPIPAMAKAKDLRVAVFTVAEDEAAVPAKVQLDRIFREMLTEGDGFTPVRIGGDTANAVKEIAHRGMIRAGNHLTEAQESFDEQMYEEALPDLIDAVNAMEEIAGFLDDLNPYLKAMAMLGVCQVLAGQGGNGVETLMRLIIIDPDFPLPGVIHGEKKVKQAMAQARKRVKSAPRSALKVETVPPGAEVFVNGKRRGTAPLELPALPEGIHLVSARMDGYQPVGGPAVIASGGEVTLHKLKLTPAPGMRAIQAALGQALAELEQPRLTPAATALAERIETGWLIIGMIQRKTITVRLDFHLYSLRSGDKLRRKRVEVSLTGDYLGRLKSFAHAFLSDVKEGKPDPEILEARNPKPRPRAQPVKAERPAQRPPPSGQPARPAAKPAGKNERPAERKPPPGEERKDGDDSGDGEDDPLEGRDGTEDW